MRSSRGRKALGILLFTVAVLLPAFGWMRLAGAAPQATAPPTDLPPALLAVPCAPLPLPSAMAFAKSSYELLLGRFLKNQCYRKLDWPHDAELRATGPTIAALDSSKDPHLPSWITTNLGTHGMVAIYYSPDVYRWLCEGDAAHERRFVDRCRATCKACRLDAADLARTPRAPIADGSMIVKLMFGNTTAERLENPRIPETPDFLALMVKDGRDTRDGWFWGSWSPTLTEASQLDWPPPANLPYPWMGSGYYCVNCHASARDESTFSALNNILGDPDTFLKFYFQDQPPIAGEPQQKALETLSAHERFEPLEELQVKIETAGPIWNKVPWPNQVVQRLREPLAQYSADFLKTFGARAVKAPDAKEITALYFPPEVYDHVAPRPDGTPLFLTSDQCVGCHAAGGTGLHFDMTVQQADQPAYSNLINLSMYGEWRGSPMGLSGRDPIFFSQLETEQAVHPKLAQLAPDVCLHCHGVMGQRQFCLDQFPGQPEKAAAVCDNSNLLGLNADSQPIVPRALFSRQQVQAIPFLARTPEQQRNSVYGGLARDGVSCAVCHHIEVGRTPIGDTFTGDFRLGPADALHGPFDQPQQKPMDHALGQKPILYPEVSSSRVCGSCHTVVLPVFDGDTPYVPKRGGKPEIILEQGTYPEWVFSDYRDDGPTPRSCQSCHMGTTYPGLEGNLKTKIAAIQEASNMPQTEERLPQSDIDLTPRGPFSRHTLVGLNVFFNQFAQQFPDVLGIRIQDPMLTSRGVAPLTTTYNSMLQQADSATATVSVTRLDAARDRLVATVRVENRAGHKFPSGVSFRRAFLTFEVLDAAGQPLWVSGRADASGVLVDAAGRPVAGEFMWQSDCRPTAPAEERFQPHYRTITREDQVQVFQELVRDPRGKLTTSFLSLAKVVKDNRLLPKGWRPERQLAEREGLGSAKYSAKDLVEHVLPTLPDGRGGEVDDPWYKPESSGGKGGGGDEVTYEVPIASLKGTAASVRATLYYQTIPPAYLQDRFCTTPQAPDTSRLFFVAGHTNLDGTRAQGWKLQVVSSGQVAVSGTGAAAAGR